MREDGNADREEFTIVPNPLFFRYPSENVTRVVAACAILALIAAVGTLVYTTGGLRSVHAHSMYIPVLMAAWLFGIRGGLTSGLIAALVIGPWMPLDVAEGVMQDTGNWIMHSMFLAGIGGSVGHLLDAVDGRTAQIRKLSSIDPTTGMPNRFAFLRRVSELAPHATAQQPVSLLTLSIDNYMEIVDAFGLTAGDRVMQATIERVREVLPIEAFAGKLQVDRIGIVVPQAAGVAFPAQELRMAFLEPVDYESLSLYLDVTIGIAEAPSHGTDAQELVQKAHIAMRSAASCTGGIARYDGEADRSSKESLALLGELPEAIRTGKLVLHYQPIIEIKSGKTIGTETLVRWCHERHGLVPPGRFVPQVENTALVHTMTSWVLESAIRQHVAWRATGLEMKMGVNISARSFQSRDIVRRVLTLIERYKVDPKTLVLEITESAVMADIQQSKTILRDLVAEGVLLSIDDFGTGHSSLRYLARLPVHSVKIDRAFIAALGRDERARRIVEVVADLAHGFGLRTIAEGVEDLADLKFLRSAGVEFAQGYGIMAPRAAEEFERAQTPLSQQGA